MSSPYSLSYHPTRHCLNSGPWFIAFRFLLVFGFSLVQLILRLTFNIIFHVITFFYYEIPY